MSGVDIQWDDAVEKSFEIHTGHKPGADEDRPSPHAADHVVEDLLESSLRDHSKSTRTGRAKAVTTEDLWDPTAEEEITDMIETVPEESLEDDVDEQLRQSGLMEMADTFTAERFNNLKGEVLSRRVIELAIPRQVLVNNFFQVIPASQNDARNINNQIEEMVDVVETFTEMGYYEIDRRAGDIPSVSPGYATDSERINTRSAYYGARINYRNFFNRVLENMQLSDILAMMTLGWAKSSAEARERDASNFLRTYLDPKPAFDNDASAESRYGQLSGRAIDATPNGTFDVDYDLPRLRNFMEFELGLNMGALAMLLPRDAWNLMNFRKGYRRFIGRDGDQLYERPEYTQSEMSQPALNQDGRYGLEGAQQAVGFETPQAASSHLAQSRQGKAGQAAAQMAPGPFPFLPHDIPNMMDEFRLPNSALGDIQVVLSKHVRSKDRYYDSDSDLYTDDVTGNPRPVKVTDMMFFDQSKPMSLMEVVPPTSWTATDEKNRRETMTMVEGYSMANPIARGQQACVIRNAVIGDNYTHEIRRRAENEIITDNPLDQGLQEDNPNQ